MAEPKQYTRTANLADLVEPEKLEQMKAQDRPMRFFDPQPYQQLSQVFQEQSKILLEAFPELVKIWQVGSSSIEGMPGMLGVDMCAQAPSWPLDPAYTDKLLALGFRSRGNSPHHGEDGMWFCRIDDPFVTIDGKEQNVGCVFHIVNKNSGALVKFISFRTLCRTKPEAFEEYKKIKTGLASMDGQSMLSYKLQKNREMDHLIQKAITWFNEQGLDANNFD